MTKTVTFTLRIPADLATRLDAIAAVQGRRTSRAKLLVLGGYQYADRVQADPRYRNLLARYLRAERDRLARLADDAGLPDEETP